LLAAVAAEDVRPACDLAEGREQLAEAAHLVRVRVRVLGLGLGLG